MKIQAIPIMSPQKSSLNKCKTITGLIFLGIQPKTLEIYQSGIFLGIFVASLRAPKARKSNAEGVRFLRGSGGILPWEILKSRVSEMLFPALRGNIQRESDGQKTTNIIHLQFVEKLTLIWLFKITQTHLTCISNI